MEQWQTKIKYTCLINSKFEGGLDLPDIKTKLETQKIMWLKKLLTTTERPWQAVVQSYIKKQGGTENIRTNFDPNVLGKHVPPFYRQCLTSWAKLVQCEPCNEAEILIQPIWNNSKIKVPSSKFNQFFYNLGISSISDLFTNNCELKKLSDFTPVNSDIYPTQILNWNSLYTNKAGLIELETNKRLLINSYCTTML